jgi:hypothetical protein
MPSKSIGGPVPLESPGFFSNVKQGFALGMGQAIAHNIFRSAPPPPQPPAPHSQNGDLPTEFVQCMKDHPNDIDLCKQFIPLKYSKE